MGRGSPGGRPTGLEAAVAALTKALSRARAEYMVIGGLAVIAHGVVRQTADADAVVNLPVDRAADLLPHLRRAGIVPRHRDALPFAKAAGVLLLRHARSGTEIDLSFAALIFEPDAIRRARSVRLGSVYAPIAQVSDLIVYKAIAGRPRDVGDLDDLLTRHADRIDRIGIRKALREYGALVDDSEPMARFEKALRLRR